jgi:hypothetical protein
MFQKREHPIEKDLSTVGVDLGVNGGMESKKPDLDQLIGLLRKTADLLQTLKDTQVDHRGRLALCIFGISDLMPTNVAFEFGLETPNNYAEMSNLLSQRSLAMAVGVLDGLREVKKENYQNDPAKTQTEIH